MTYELIKNKKLPSAIFAASDPIAIGAMRALKQYDIKIPEEVSIIGFDNIETTNYTDPPLTTVFAPTFDMGFMAADNSLMLLNIMKIFHQSKFFYLVFNRKKFVYLKISRFSLEIFYHFKFIRCFFVISVACF